MEAPDEFGRCGENAAFGHCVVCTGSGTHGFQTTGTFVEQYHKDIDAVAEPA